MTYSLSTATVLFGSLEIGVGGAVANMPTEGARVRASERVLRSLPRRVLFVEGANSCPKGGDERGADGRQGHSQVQECVQHESCSTPPRWETDADKEDVRCCDYAWQQ